MKFLREWLQKFLWEVLQEFLRELLWVAPGVPPEIPPKVPPSILLGFSRRIPPGITQKFFGISIRSSTENFSGNLSSSCSEGFSRSALGNTIQYNSFYTKSFASLPRNSSSRSFGNSCRSFVRNPGVSLEFLREPSWEFLREFLQQFF